LNIVDAIKDENLFRPFFGSSIKTWRPWLVALRVLHGLPVTSKFGQDLIRQCTGRDPKKLPKEGFDTALFLTGRRSGKSRISATIGAYAAVLAGYHKKLDKGEKGLVPVVCPTVSQGRVVQGYLRAIFETPMLREELVSDRKNEFEFRNSARVEILPGDFRHSRGYTLLSVIVDEIAFFGLSEESKVRSDTELIRALQPALATTGGKMICIGSPYARKGWCWTTYRKHFGNNKSNVLVWNAPSRVMNSTLPQKVIDRAMAEDMAAAKSEYMGEFRDDVGIFLPREVIENLFVSGRIENLPRGKNRYFAFADISGGRSDGSALAIAHKEGRKIVIDFAQLWTSPANPHQVIASMSEELRRFKLYRVTGDNYGAEFCATSFQANGVHYVKCEMNKSALYSELLPIICANEVELLDNPTVVNQLANLERRTRSGGKDIIDHPPGGHDDMANAVAGVTVTAAARAVFIGTLGI